MTPQGQVLKIFLDDLVRDSTLFPAYDVGGNLQKTFCNFGVLRQAPGEVFEQFKDMMAEQMACAMRDDKTGIWKPCSGLDASNWALDGKRAIAAMTAEEMGEAHAHVARVYPAMMEMSGSLGRGVPLVANIGKGDPSKDLYGLPGGAQTKPNWVCKSSQAFPIHSGEAHYFLFLG